MVAFSTGGGKSVEADRLRVLAVADYYLPGFRGGGPIRTLANMRHALRDHLDLDIFTRDRDLCMNAAYPEVEPNRWLPGAGGQVYYATPKQFGPRGIQRALTNRRYHIIYLNSFFSIHGSILVNAVGRRNGWPKIVIAPRGEFSPGALSLKPKKKRAFIALSTAVGLYRRAYWHVSSSKEKIDLLRVFPGVAPQVYIAADPVEATIDKTLAPAKTAGHLKLIFVSRISEKKNLDGLLRILAHVRRRVSLDIYGPIEDHSYWDRCNSLVEQLPSHVVVSWKGAVDPESINSKFASYDLFAFPTRGENFGHVIFESLRAGTPVLSSDQTPWAEDGSAAIRVLPLSDIAQWRDAIETAADRSGAVQVAVRAAAQDYARAYAQADVGAADTLDMFRAVAHNTR